nr:hypothetical protein [uncultured Draconibacterium sp.]
MSDYVVIPHYSLKPNAITLYETVESSKGFGRMSEGWENLRDNTNYFGELSPHSYKRLRKTIDFMLYLAKEQSLIGKRIITKSQTETTEYEKGQTYSKPVKFKLTFITLTLPAKQKHSDQEIKSKCLNHFLTTLRRKWKVELYIWKAEKQENGNIHFHILANKFIKWQDIRSEWNKIIQKLGYVSSYQQNMRAYFSEGFRMSENPKDKRTRAAQIKAYEQGKKENWTNPNSTDIHALYKVKNVSAYIAKYISKNVTKTERIQRMKQIKTTVQDNNIQINELEKQAFFSGAIPSKVAKIERQIAKIKEQTETILNENEELLKQGVSGKIWGCSQKLSKCKNFTTVENWNDIPDIEAVMKAKTFETKLQIGSRIITTICFDLNKTPFLKQKLDEHLRYYLEE